MLQICCCWNRNKSKQKKNPICVCIFSLLTKSFFFLMRSYFFRQILSEATSLSGSAVLFNQKLNCIFTQRPWHRQPVSVTAFPAALPTSSLYQTHHTSCLGWLEQTIRQISLQKMVLPVKQTAKISETVHTWLAFHACMKCLWLRSYWFYFLSEE